MARGGQPSSTGEVQASTLAVLGEQRVVRSTNIFLLSGYEGILTVDSSLLSTALCSAQNQIHPSYIYQSNTNKPTLMKQIFMIVLTAKKVLQ
jgi:hypothetical protein